MKNMRQIDASERYLQKIESKKASANATYIISLMGALFVIACFYIAYILKGINE